MFAQPEEILAEIRKSPKRFGEWSEISEEDLRYDVEQIQDSFMRWYVFRAYWDGEKPDMDLDEKSYLKGTRDGMQRWFDRRKEYAREFMPRVWLGDEDRRPVIV